MNKKKLLESLADLPENANIVWCPRPFLEDGKQTAYLFASVELSTTYLGWIVKE